MSSFAELRAKQGNALEKIKNRISEQKVKGNPAIDDETYWDISHVRGKEGVGSAVVRFLPATDGEDVEYVSWEEYAFQGPSGEWYINRNRKSLSANEKDPVYEYNGKIFADKSLGEEERKKRLLGRRRYTVANILIVKDPNKPENEGKVKKWKFGPQIFGMIEESMFPNKELNPTAVSVNPFDPIEGANFILRVTTKKIGNKDVPSYEKSGFDAPTPLCAIEDFDAIWKQQHKLLPLVDRSQWDTYENLVQRFNQVMGIGANVMDSNEPVRKATTTATAQPKTTASQDMNDEIPFIKGASTHTQAKEFDDNDDEWFSTLKQSPQGDSNSDVSF